MALCEVTLERNRVCRAGREPLFRGLCARRRLRVRRDLGHRGRDHRVRPALRPIHVDHERAVQGPFGALIASGGHTTAMMMRLIVDNFLPKSASLGSPGIDELRWLRPVRPGDVLSVRLSILEATRSRSKPDRGVVWTLCEVLNQSREVVMSLKAMNIIACRSIP